MEKDKLKLAEVIEEMKMQAMKNKMSLQLFSEWTRTLQDKMHVELQVLSDNNIKLQVENQIMKQRMEPLLSIEKQVIAQEDVEV